MKLLIQSFALLTHFSCHLKMNSQYCCFSLFLFATNVILLQRSWWVVRRLKIRLQTPQRYFHNGVKVWIFVEKWFCTNQLDQIWMRCTFLNGRDVALFKSWSRYPETCLINLYSWLTDVCYSSPRPSPLVGSRAVEAVTKQTNKAMGPSRAQKTTRCNGKTVVRAQPASCCDNWAYPQ